MTPPLSAYLSTVMISALPLVELRGGIPWGLFRENLPWAGTAAAAVIGNFLPVIPVYLGIEKTARFFSRYPRGAALFGWLFTRTRRRSKAAACTEFLGLTLFVGIPLPMTGAWTGAVAASLLGVPGRRAIPAIALGIALAGVIVTIVALGLGRGWRLVSPEMARFFIGNSPAW